MKKLALAVLLSLGFLGCAESGSFESPIDPQYQKYYDAFVQEAAQYGYNLKNIPLRIVKRTVYEGDYTVPVKCYNYGVIEVNDTLVKTFMNVGGRNGYEEFVLYHALGHCLLNLRDVSDRLSIMNVDAYPWDYETNRSIYIFDLFSWSTNFPEVY